MPIGLSIHVGVNTLDKKHYGTTFERLSGAENDAGEMATLAEAAGFEVRPALLGADATSTAVTAELEAAADELHSGDILFVSYAGHGSRIKDTNDDEGDGLDEAWCLFDRMMPDDEVLHHWASFREGVRILVVCDSCHSGTVGAFTRSSARLNASMADAADASGQTTGRPVARLLPPTTVEQIRQQHLALYDGLQQRFVQGSHIQVQASGLLLSACQDNQLTADGIPNGVFTAALLQVWARGAFSGGYLAFHKALFDLLRPVQTPNFLRFGVPDPVFESQRPFTP